MDFRASRCALAFGLLALGAVSCRHLTADDHIKRGGAYVAGARLAEAVVEYRLALQLAPNRADVRLKLADVYRQLNDAQGTLNETVKAADLLPGDAAAQLRAGSMLLMAGDFEDAKTRANRALAIDPRNAPAQILLGNALAGLQDLDGAIAEYEQAILFNPTEDAAYTSIGVIRLARGGRVEAEVSFRKAIAVAPKSIAARLALANFLWASNRMKEAEQALKEVLALDQANISANRALGVFYLTSNRAAEAEPFFKKIADTAKTTAATLSLADYYAYMKRFAEARGLLNELVKQGGPAATTALTRLAAVDALEGDRVQALEKARAILSKYPTDAAARLLSARLLRYDGKRTEAITQAQAVVDDESSGPLAGEAYLLIGGIQTDLGHTDQAIDAYERVLKREPQTLTAALRLAALHLTNGAYEKAEGYAKQALAMRPGNPQARVLLVRAALVQHDVSAARSELASLQRDFPDAPIVLNLVGGLQLQNRQVDSARVAFTKAAAQAPDNLESIAGLVAIDLGTGRTKEALNRIAKGLKQQPPASFLILAARTYAAAGDLTRTEEMLKRAIDAEPGNLQAYGLLGQFYVDHQRIAEGRERFQQLATLDPKSVSANTMLGMLLESERRVPEAEAQYQKVLVLDPHAAVAANNLAYLYAATNKNLDQALQLALVAQAQMPDEPHVSDTVGWVCYRKQMTSVAIRNLEASLAKDSSDPTSHYHLGMAYAQAGDRVRARQELQRALAFKADFDGIDEARTTLARLGS